MKASKGRDRKRRATVDSVSPKKKKPETEVPNPLRVDEEEFTEVIRKMVNTSPVTRKNVEGGFGYRRKKNPHEPVFDFPNLPGRKKKN